MKIKITDLITSVKIFNARQKSPHLFQDCNDIKAYWALRVHHHTKEELEVAHSKYPRLITMPVEDFCLKIGDEIKDEDKGKTAVSFPYLEGIAFFMRSYPAYDVLPDDFIGEFVEVDFD